MTQFLCWVLFPLVLALLSLGCGLLLERAAGLRLSEGLLLPVGLAVVVVVAEIPTKSAATAKVTTPLVVALALIGLTLGKPWRDPKRLLGWPLVAAGAVYLAFLAPVLLSGSPTFAGYIKLDDTATWMAMTDRVLSHGHSLSGLAPSTYDATLHFYLNGGEPVGAFLPWGIGHQLVGRDLAWVFQPYMAFLGAMLALSAWAVIGPLIRSRVLRALVVFIAAQSALIYGYSLWGGVKEVAAAWLLALTPACAVLVFENEARLRSFLPLVAASFGMLSVLAFGGAVWLAVVLVVVGLVAFRIRLRTGTRAQLAALAGLAAVLAFGLIRGAENFLKANGALTSSELGNLVHPLNWLQLFGIWPADDFRLDPPHASTLAHILIVLVIVAALLGLLVAWTQRWWPPWLYVSAAAIGLLLVSAKGSPWVEGKAFATASPAALLVGLAGAVFLVEDGRTAAPRERRRRLKSRGLDRRAGAAVAGIAMAIGVLWSNVLAYHHVTLAPYGQFSELERIGQRFAGQGPTLLNEFQVYGARHFLRNMDAESPSELRRRVIPLLTGGQVHKGGYADLDQFQIPALYVYRSIVLRTSPVASRPPADYRLVYRGKWYEVWQRPVIVTRPIAGAILLGNSIDPTAVASCGAVLKLARKAGAHGVLAAVARPVPTVITVPSPLPSGITQTAFVVTTPGLYRVWLDGSFVRHLTTYVDGVRIGSAGEQLNQAGEWTPLGEVHLGIAAHRVTLSYGDAALAPGSGGPGDHLLGLPVGPLAVAPAKVSLPVTYVSTSAVRSLCGKAWDWIEAFPR